MAWSEIMKVNTDMGEPLNYYNYIEDIQIHGDESFIFKPQFDYMWRELCVKSLLLYTSELTVGFVDSHLDDVQDRKSVV